jgi:hypothetical protein
MMTDTCWLPGCQADPVAQWSRRLTPAETDAEIALVMDRRAEILALADPDAPEPDLGPPPTGADWTAAVHACGPHAIHIEDAALIHQATCVPDPARLPACGCTPESAPPPVQLPQQETVTLPTGWVVAADPVA